MTILRFLSDLISGCRLGAYPASDHHVMPDIAYNVPIPSSIVTLVFEVDAYSVGVQEALRKFLVVNDDRHAPDRLEELSECRITEVEHFRRADGLKVHEFVVLKIQRGPDVRYVKIERFRRDLKDRGDNKKIQIVSFHNSLRKSYLRTGPGTFPENLYTVVGVKEDVMLKGSLLVQSFHPPPSGNLNVLDCVILANTISRCSQDYTTLHHMCMWWAALFFISIHRFSESTSGDVLDLERGEVFAERGTLSGVQLVNGKGELCLRSPNILPNFLVVMKQLLRGGETAQEDIDTVIKEVNKDAELERTACLSPAGIFSLFQRDRERVQDEIKKEITVRNEEREKQAQKDVQLRIMDARLQEADTQLHEKDAHIMTLEKQLGLLRSPQGGTSNTVIH